MLRQASLVMTRSRVRNGLAAALLSSCVACAGASAPWSLKLTVVPCGEARPPEHLSSHVLARGAAMVGEMLVVVGEAEEAFQVDGSLLRCPSSKAYLVLGFGADGAPRFQHCLDGSHGFPKLLSTPGGFAVVARVARGAAPEPPIPASASPRREPSDAEELDVYRFDLEGRLVVRTAVVEDSSLAGGAGAAATGDGSVFIAVALPTDRRKPILTPFTAGAVVEDHLFRVDVHGASTDLGTRTRGLATFGNPVAELVALRSGGVARAIPSDRGIEVAAFREDGAVAWTWVQPVEGSIVDFVASARGDDVLVAWTSRVGDADPPNWRRRLAAVGARGVLGVQPLGHEDINAHVYGVVARGEHGADVLFEVWPNRGEPHVFEGLTVSDQGTVAVVAYDLDSASAPRLVATVRGYDVTALDFERSGNTTTISGWFHGGIEGRTPGRYGCGAFAAVASQR